MRLQKRFVSVRVEVGHRHADQLVAGIAQAFARLTVHFENGSVFSVEHERVGRMVHEGAKAGLACPQLLLGPLALGQVEHESDTLVPGFFEGRRSNQDGHATAVFAEVFLLVWRDGSGRCQLGQGALSSGAPFRRRQLGPVQATPGEILAVVSHHFKERIIRLSEAHFVRFVGLPFDLELENPHDVGIDQTPDLRFAFPEGLLGPHALGRIEREGAHAVAHGRERPQAFARMGREFAGESQKTFQAFIGSGCAGRSEAAGRPDEPPSQPMPTAHSRLRPPDRLKTTAGLSLFAKNRELPALTRAGAISACARSWPAKRASCARQWRDPRLQAQTFVLR